MPPHTKDVPDADNGDDADDVHVDARERWAGRLLTGVAGGGSAVVVALFFVTIAQLQPLPDVGVVVVADPAVAQGAPLAVRVLGVGSRSRATFTGSVDGRDVDEGGRVVVPRVAALAVRGFVDDVAVAVDVVLPTRSADASVDVVPWTRALALPAAGAAVYPETGHVAGRGVSRVLLVDDVSADVFVVEAGANARLPDGRLLLVDRAPLQARFSSLSPGAGGDIVVEVAGVDEEQPLAFELLVDGVVRSMADAHGPGAHALRLPPDAAVGALVVVHVATSPLPSASGRTLVTRIGGPRPEDLTRVEPRIAHVARGDVDEDVVARALLARLSPRMRQAPVVSPSLQVQAARREADRNVDVARWRGRLRAACLVLWAMVWIAAARTARRAPMVAAGAVLVVFAVLLGLDVVVGAMAGTLGG